MQVELLSWKSIKDIAGDGGVIKTIETEGKGWEKPKDRDEALGECCHLPLHLSCAILCEHHCTCGFNPQHWLWLCNTYRISGQMLQK